MINKPKLKSFLTIFPLSESTWGLRGGSGELWKIKLQDDRSLRALGALIPHLDGRSELTVILREMAEQGLDSEIVQALIHELEKLSLIEDAGASTLDPAEQHRLSDQISFLSRFATRGTFPQERIHASQVAVVGDNHLATSLRRHLATSGFGKIFGLVDDPAAASESAGALTAEIPGAQVEWQRLDRREIWPAPSPEDLPQLFIFAQCAHDPQLLEAMDTFSKRHHASWLLVRALDPHEGWVGPLFVPGDTPSYLSLEARLRGNLTFIDEYRTFAGYLQAAERPSVPCGGLQVTFDLLSSIAVTEIIKHVSGISFSQLAGRFLTVNLLNWETEIHEVLRVPRLELESYSRPRIFPWKDAPYGDKQTRRA